MKCLQCGLDNPSQKFCGSCGAPLHLESFIARQVKTEFEQRTRLRDLVERESAIKIFDTAVGWLKKCAIVVAVVVAPFAAVGIYKWSDLLATITTAKESVAKTADEQRKAIETASAEAQSKVNQEGNAVVQVARSAKSQITRDSALAKVEVSGLHQQLEAAAKLQPEMASLREELSKQQKAFSSSEAFARSIFSSHQVEFFQPDPAPSNRYRILPRKSGNGATVYLLLSKPPVPQTIQLQYHVFSQPENSHANIHNLVIFNWGDPAANLNAHQISVSYFPDSSDKELIKSLDERDGRIYADGEPLPLVAEPDPGFAGNKWIPVVKK